MGFSCYCDSNDVSRQKIKEQGLFRLASPRRA